MVEATDALSDSSGLPLDIPAIPAMTSEAERRCYYRLAKEQNCDGYVVELGAWLGASTAWIAAGVRDSGCPAKAHIYDRWIWDAKQHERKAGGPLQREMMEQFKNNLGPLLDYVEPHRGEIADLVWTKGAISLLICDAPKRVKAISQALTAFADDVYDGTILVWQDFTHSASYDIAATCSRLRDKLVFVKAVPGSTVLFKVREPWTKEEVTQRALSTDHWTLDEIDEAWTYWLPYLPRDMAANFLAGQAMFMCERGAPDKARALLREVLSNYGDGILGHWRNWKARPRFVQRFGPLFHELRGRL